MTSGKNLDILTSGTVVNIIFIYKYANYRLINPNYHGGERYEKKTA
jgi:hypothetical protein